MAVSNALELLKHAGHKLEVAWYGDKKDPANVSIACKTCDEVLVDFNNDQVFTEPLCDCEHLKSEHTDGCRGANTGACKVCSCSEFKDMATQETIKEARCKCGCLQSEHYDDYSLGINRGACGGCGCLQFINGDET